MLGRHSGRIVPTIGTTCSNIKTKIETTHRIWLKLILSALIPLMIGVFTITTTLMQQRLSFQQRDQDKQDTRSLRIQSDQQADNLQKEAVLVTYLNDVSKLLMLENDTKIYTQIRTKTLTSLRQLDSERKKYLFLFLYESELINQSSKSTLLKIRGADFNNIYFKGTLDNRCSFLRLYLYDVYLSNATFIDCYIDYSNFSYASMNKVMFSGNILIRSSFRFSSLDNSTFVKTKLTGTSFIGASLTGSNFTGCVWENASVDFTSADLSKAILSDAQLKNSTLMNSRLPNDTWGPIQTKNLIDNGDLNQNCTLNSGHKLNGWTVSSDGEIRVFPTNYQNLKCYFRVILFNNSKNHVYMIQNINLENFTLLISEGHARYNASARFQCIGKQYATMQVHFTDFNGLRDGGVFTETKRETQMQTIEISNNVRLDTRSVRILITIFRSYDKNDTNATIDDNYCACYHINFSIMKV